MGWVQNIPIGKIKRQLILPCQVTPAIWVEVTALALLRAFWTIEGGDWKSVVHKTTGSTWLCHLKGVMKDAKEVEGGLSSPGFRAAFKAIEWVDLASWWLFLGDVGANGLINWQSALMNIRGCQGSLGPAAGYGETASDGGPADGSWNYGPTWAPLGPSPVGNAGPGVIIGPGQSGYIAGQETLSPVTSGPVIRSGLRIRWQDTGQVLDQDVHEWEPFQLAHQHHVFASGANTGGHNRILGVESMMVQQSALPRYVGSGLGLGMQDAYG